MTLALWCAIVMLPFQLCACRRYRNLAESSGYDLSNSVIPSKIPTYLHDVETSELGGPVSNAMLAPEPTRLRSGKELIPWDMTLQEVVFHALSNANVIRQSGQFLSPNNSLLRSPEGIQTAYDTAIQSSGVLFGQRGYQAALSEFDTQFTTRMLWGNSSTVQNNTSGGLNGGETLAEDSAQFQAVLQRALLSGGQFGLSHTWNYSSNNQASRLFPSDYEGFLRAEFRQPLLAGSGRRYTSIAGPISENIQGVTGVQQGMLISKINNIIAQFDYEISVTNFLRDVEMQYWRLYIAYQTYDIEKESLADANRILDMVQARADAPGGDLSRVVEARDGVLQAEQRVLDALESVYTNETQLRLLINHVGDPDRTIRPIDMPVLSDMELDWSGSLSEALIRRPELRRQKKALQSAQLQLEAAENLYRPRIDFVASGQFNGMGDALLGPSHSSKDPNSIESKRSLGSAYGRLLAGRETGWNIGGELSLPLGLRFAREQVKNNELKVTKSMRILEAQEHEILAELTAAFQKVDKAYLAMKKFEQVVDNAEDRLSAAEADYESNKEGRGFLDLDSLNRARDIYAQAHVQLTQAQVEYSMALTEIELRCGRLLEHHGVTLAFGDDQARGYMNSGVVPAIESQVPGVNGEEQLPTPAEESPPSAPVEPERAELLPAESEDGDHPTFEPVQYQEESTDLEENAEESEPVSLETYLNE